MGSNIKDGAASETLYGIAELAEAMASASAPYASMKTRG